MAGQERGKLRRHAMGSLLEVFVQRGAQVGIRHQGFTKPQPGVGEALLDAGVVALHIGLQPLAQVGPHLTQIAVKGLVVLQILFDVLRFSRGFRIVFQVFHQLQHRAIEGLTDLVGAVMADVIQDGIHRIRDQLGALIPQPLGGQDHRLARVFGLQPVDDLRGDKVAGGVALQERNQAVNHRVQQHLVAVIFGHALQHRGAGFAEIDLIQRLVHRPLEHALNAAVVGQLKEAAHHLHDVLPDALGVIRLAEPVADKQSRFMFANQRHQRLGIQKFLLHEPAEIVANPVFITRDNRRMTRNKRDRHPTKQGHHGKPVSESTDHRRFGNGLHPPHPEGLRQEEGGDKGRGGNQQQRQRQELGAFEFSEFFHRVKDRGKRREDAK